MTVEKSGERERLAAFLTVTHSDEMVPPVPFLLLFFSLSFIQNFYFVPCTIYGSSKFELEAIESKAHWIGERVNPRNILVIELHFRWMLFESIELDILFSLRASFFERKRIYITKPFLAKGGRSIVPFGVDKPI